MLNTKSLESVQDYRNVMDSVEYMLSDPKFHVRLKILLSDQKILNDNGIDLLRKKFAGEKRLKIVIKDMMKDKKKKEDKEKTKEIKDRFAFVMDPNQNPADIIHEFILITKNKDIDVNIIHNFIDQYLNKV